MAKKREKIGKYGNISPNRYLFFKFLTNLKPFFQLFSTFLSYELYKKKFLFKKIGEGNYPNVISLVGYTSLP